jgi:hypothetical protein
MTDVKHRRYIRPSQPSELVAFGKAAVGMFVVVGVMVGVEYLIYVHSIPAAF